jgi:hypothetical protein
MRAMLTVSTLSILCDSAIGAQLPGDMKNNIYDISDLSRPRNVRTPDYKDVKIAAVGTKHGEAHAVSY